MHGLSLSLLSLQRLPYLVVLTMGVLGVAKGMHDLFIDLGVVQQVLRVLQVMTPSTQTHTPALDEAHDPVYFQGF